MTCLHIDQCKIYSIIQDGNADWLPDAIYYSVEVDCLWQIILHHFQFNAKPNSKGLKLGVELFQRPGKGAQAVRSHLKLAIWHLLAQNKH